MSEFKGTPGPWINDVRGGCVAVYQDGRQEDTQGCHRDDERNIAYSNKGAEYDEVFGFWAMDKKTIHDFNLIAAAPELLEVLQLILSYHDDGNCALHKEDVVMARNAIKKALGQ
ncbi:hypothetical protein [Pantoea eucrina]|uniref:hypothetical protein n=1 Tax=Pantoea eucrina TaxID=472693 RepID=UPI00080F48C6|nr:hypothetical protein [Pantoea eucrina]